MTRNEYIEALRLQLRKLPEPEREDAIAFYAEYLEEAGPEGEAAAMARLGPPERLAAGVRADAAMEALEETAAAPDPKQDVARADGAEGGRAAGRPAGSGADAADPDGAGVWRAGGVEGSSGFGADGTPGAGFARKGKIGWDPGVKKGVAAVWLSVLGAIPRTALASFVAALVIVFVFGGLLVLFAIAAAVMFTGVAGIGVSFFAFGAGVAAGLFYFGCGLALIPIGWFLWRFVAWVWKHAWRGVAAVFNGIRRRRERRRAAESFPRA